MDSSIVVQEKEPYPKNLPLPETNKIIPEMDMDICPIIFNEVDILEDKTEKPNEIKQAGIFNNDDHLDLLGDLTAFDLEYFNLK
jgi:hypothetical protein